jgi:hypothetical protein
MLKPPPFLDELSVRLSELLAHTPAADIEKNVRALLTASFERLDLVTREDFEVQRKVLERTQAQLALLEARLNQLEGRSPTK